MLISTEFDSGATPVLAVPVDTAGEVGPKPVPYRTTVSPGAAGVAGMPAIKVGFPSVVRQKSCNVVAGGG